jgi:hypothetical protein
MGSSTIPAASAADPSDNWQLISSVAGSGATVTFSSISGYKKLMLRGVSLATNSGADANWIIRFNGDTGTKYDYAFAYANSSVADKYAVTTATGATSIGFPGGFYASGTLVLTANNTDTTGIKTIIASMGGANTSGFSNGTSDLTGNYLASASVSSVSINVSTSTITGTLSLYGVAV